MMKWNDIKIGRKLEMKIVILESLGINEEDFKKYQNF